MTWDAYHRRKNALREMLEIADRDRNASLTDLLDTVDPDRVAFDDEIAVLFDLQMLWFQRLSGTADRLVADGTDDFEMVAIDAWVEAAAELPGARALLDRHADRPELAKAFAKERAFIAGAAGIPVQHPDLVERGATLIASARDAADRAPTEPVGEVDLLSSLAARRDRLVARLRSVIAA
jgi:hypothetical protein